MADRFKASDCDKLRAELKEVFERYHNSSGIHLSMGNMTYSDTDIAFKVTATRVEAGADPEEAKDRASLNKYGHLFGVTEEDYGLQLEANGRRGKETITLLGVNPRAPKYPLLVRGADGKRYRWMEGPLTRHLKKKKTEA